MHAEDLVIYQGCNWHAVENILELFPDSNAVSSLAFVVETIDPVNLPALVIASEQEEVLFEFDLVCQE